MFLTAVASWVATSDTALGLGLRSQNQAKTYVDADLDMAPVLRAGM